MQELKEDGILVWEWFKGKYNSADIFTKNLGSRDFNEHGKECAREDEYM